MDTKTENIKYFVAWRRNPKSEYYIAFLNLEIQKTLYSYLRGIAVVASIEPDPKYTAQVDWLRQYYSIENGVAKVTFLPHTNTRPQIESGHLSIYLSNELEESFPAAWVLLMQKEIRE